MKIYVVGSLNMDLVINAPYMPKSGMTVTGSGFMANAGGKGANQAVAVSKLGGACYMVGCVGKEFGEELLATVRGYGVHTDHIARVQDVSSGIAMITVIDGDNRIILDRGANGRLTYDMIDKALSSARKGDYLIAQLETEISVVQYAFRRAKDIGMVTLLNPAPAAKLPHELFSLCDYFAPNQTEAEFYTGVYPSGNDSIAACADWLKRLGVRGVLITLGEEGSVFVGDGVFYKAEARRVKAVDTTGAGDTYIGAFVTRLSEGASVEQAMDFASAASAITVTRRGAQQSIPVREEVKN